MWMPLAQVGSFQRVRNSRGMDSSVDRAGKTGHDGIHRPHRFEREILSGVGPGFRWVEEDKPDAVGHEAIGILVGDSQEVQANQIGPACCRKEAVEEQVTAAKPFRTIVLRLQGGRHV
jgi:hypothetical protein